MDKMTYKELKQYFTDYNNKHDHNSSHVIGCIVFTEDSFTRPYSLESRTYEVSSDNKAFVPGMGGYSIFGWCMDGTDPGVRLERYMEEEAGVDGHWKVDYCYLKDS